MLADSPRSSSCAADTAWPHLVAGKAELSAALAVLDWAYRVMRYDGDSVNPEPAAWSPPR